MARLVFLGRLEDLAGAPEIACVLSGPTTLSDLLATLPPLLAEALRGPRVRVAVNGELVDPAAAGLTDGDEIAFLPPVSGG